MQILERAANGFTTIAIPSGATYTLSTTDQPASAENGHFKAIKFTSADQACTVTLAQSSHARLYMILNSTSYTLTITQRTSGTTTGASISVDILAGKSAIVLADGAGDSTAVVTDFTALIGSISELSGVAAGTVSASKAVVADSNKDITGFRNITLTGELDAGSLDVSGDIDVDGTSNLDNTDIDGTLDLSGVFTLSGGSSNWTVTASGTNLTFAYGGVNKMRLDSSGNLTVTGDVTAFGTIS